MLFAVQIILMKLINETRETCKEHKLKAEGNFKKKGDCVECKPLFHLHTFPGPVKCKQTTEAWIKAVRRKLFDKKRS